MSSFFLFLLFFLLWTVGFYLQLYALQKQVGRSAAASYLRRCTMNRAPLDLNSGEEDQHRVCFGIFLMLKAGKLLLFSLLLRVVIFARWEEAVLLILLLLPSGLPFIFSSSSNRIIRLVTESLFAHRGFWRL